MDPGSQQQGRSNGRPQAPPDLRDAAFSSIFGAAPPPGRSQMTPSQSQSPVRNDRTQTMSSMSPQASSVSARAPPPRQPLPQPPQGYFNQAPNGYHQQQQQTNGNPPAQISPSHQQPQPQYLPQPINPDRRPYPPQRVDPRAPQMPGQYNKNLPQRGYPSGPAPPPALNSSAFRSQSLVSSARPSYQAANSYSASSANNLRQQPYVNKTSHTTAQGRIVPERHDERSMSMSAFARDRDHSQTSSGRVIPQRQREPSIRETEPRPSMDSNASTQSYASYQQHLPGAKTRTPSVDTQSTRTMSMASTIAPSIAPSDLSQATTYRPGMPSTRSGSSSQMTAIPRRRGPVIYGAILSNVAEAFRERMGTSDKSKNGVLYKNAFTGSEAVDLLCYIVQTPDRNLALLLGRTLDGKSQKLFHDVDYTVRLRDSPDELYQFRETFNEEGNINGVFNLLTSCYSPTCTSENLCYSISCPNRTAQQKHLNMRVQSTLKREVSRISLHEDVDQTDEQKLWINSVSPEIANKVGERERKRQEVISELVYTERDFCKDLGYLRDAWMMPLRGRAIPPRPSPISERRREQFIGAVFANCQQILEVNDEFSLRLSKRQRAEPVVRNVGDIFLEYIPQFGPFITYGANQMFGKYEYERERQSNPAFARFADEVERQPESRKLELNGYLTKPTTRLARYPLLLENILKYTAEDNPDKTDLPKAIAGIKNLLSRVNIESGKTENRFNLMMLEKTLTWPRPNEYVDLKLTEEARQLLFKASLRKTPTDTNGEITAYLFDHALLFARSKLVNKREELKVWKRPIPLGLLVMSAPDDYNPKMGLVKRPSSSLISATRSTTSMSSRPEPNRQGGYPITFRHLGRGGFEQILYCTSQIQRQKWFEHVDAQQNALRERSNIFTKTILNEGFFTSIGMRINCCVPIDGGRKLIVGTDIGVYVTERKPKDASIKPKRVLDVKNVTQIDVLEQHNILLILYDKSLYSYAIEALDPEESATAQSKRGRKIGHASFFKVGIFEGQHLVCSVKPPTSLGSVSDIKIYKPESMPSGKKKSGLAKMLAGGQEVLKPYKEFYIPSETYSVHFLKSTLCVGCARGYEIVELASLATQPLLDQADTSLDFVVQRENLKPIHVERISGRDFLLCYSEFSFFVDRLGWRAFPEWKINWEGNPQSFAVFQPYILAFEPSFIEMRHLETGMLVYILTAKNIRMLHSSTREILYAYEDEMGEDVIASLDFWGRPQDGARTGVEKTER